MAPIHLLCNQLATSSKAKLTRIAVPYSKTNLAIAHILYKEGLLSSLATGDVQGPFSAAAATQMTRTASHTVTPANVASRRLWLQLKYRHGESVLKHIGVVSKPSRKVFASLPECKALASGTLRSNHPTLPKSRFGQVVILDTPFGIIELQEALTKGVGGEVLCFAA